MVAAAATQRVAVAAPLALASAALYYCMLLLLQRVRPPIHHRRQLRRTIAGNKLAYGYGGAAAPSLALRVRTLATATLLRIIQSRPGGARPLRLPVLIAGIMIRAHHARS